MKKYKAITVISWVFLFGLIFVFPFGINDLLNTDFSAFTTNTYLAITFVIIGTTFLTYLFNLKICFANQKVTAPEDIDFKIDGTPIKIGSFVKPSSTITVTPTGSGTPATLNNEASSIQTPKDIAYFFYSNGEAPNPVIPEDLGYYMRFGHLLEYVKEFLIPKVKNAGGKKFPLIELDTTTDNKMYYFPNQIQSMGRNLQQRCYLVQQ